MILAGNCVLTGGPDGSGNGRFPSYSQELGVRELVRVKVHSLREKKSAFLYEPEPVLKVGIGWGIRLGSHGIPERTLQCVVYMLNVWNVRFCWALL